MSQNDLAQVNHPDTVEIVPGIMREARRSRPVMLIRSYQPGDEGAQARIYNTVADALPGFKPASPDEVARRSRTSVPDPASTLYAVEGGEVVGYAVLNA